MKTPEAIKKGLECCAKVSPEACYHCPYMIDCETFGSAGNLSRDAMAYINQLEARAPKWISVEKRMPNDNTLNIVFMRRSGKWGFCTFKIAIWFDGKWDGPLYPWEVTHWMPLPEPPKEE